MDTNNYPEQKETQTPDEQKLIPISKEELKVAQEKAQESLQKHGGGRPTALNGEVIGKLVAILQRGLSIETACDIAGINPDTYYSWKKQNREFSERVTAARQFGKQLAADTIMDVLQDFQRVQYDEYSGKVTKHGRYSSNQRAETAKWYLERQDPKAFSTKAIQITNIQNNQENTVTILSHEELAQLSEQLYLDEMNPSELLEALESENDETFEKLYIKARLKHEAKRIQQNTQILSDPDHKEGITENT